jgi:hypothetical protein
MAPPHASSRAERRLGARSPWPSPSLSVMPPFRRSRSGVRAWRPWWARCPSMLRANGTAVAARSRLTRRALCGMSGRPQRSASCLPVLSVTGTPRGETPPGRAVCRRRSGRHGQPAGAGSPDPFPRIGGCRRPWWRQWVTSSTELISGRHETIRGEGRQFGEVHHAQTLRPLPAAAKRNVPGAA